MKIIRNTILVISFLISFSLKSQNTYVPDDKFELALINRGYDVLPLNDSVPTANVNTITYLDVSYSGIDNFTGIEDFLLLDTLIHRSWVSSNDTIFNLDLSINSALTYLNVSGNYLDSLDLTSNILLKYVYINTTHLKHIDLSNNLDLVYLDISNNPLDSLDVTNNNFLEHISCSNDSLKTLDLSNNLDLIYLQISNNSLDSLDVTNNSFLSEIYCQDNQITILDVSNNDSIEKLWCYNNQLSSLLGLSNLSKLGYLSCSSNQLITLDVSNNPNLSTLYCTNNMLTTIDIANGNNTALANWDFNFINNPSLGCVKVDDVRYSSMTWFRKDPQSYFSTTCTGVFGPRTYVPDDDFEKFLTNAGFDNGALDDSILTSAIDTITYLHVYSPFIKSLIGIEDFTSLKKMIVACRSDSLDLSNNIFLESLWCQYNQIKYLNISNNINLKRLQCDANLLDTLDISNNTNLTYLSCSNNQLTGLLDLSNNINLDTLYAGSNLFDSVHLLNCSLLTNIQLNSNLLTSLDLSGNPILEKLYVSSNQLSVLDFSTNLFFRDLNCYNNQLLSLDFSSNLLLKRIGVGNNQLTSLNVNTGSNNFKFLAVYGNPLLTCIQVNDTAYSRANWTLPSTSSFFSLDCGYVRRNIVDSTSCNNYITSSGIILSKDTVLTLDTIKDHTGLNDSIINVLNFKLDTSSAQIDTSIFSSYTTPSGVVLTSSIMGYIDTIPNASGCDSLITINLNIKNCRAKYTKTQPAPGQVTLIDSTVGNNLKYTWYFGDGDSSVSMLPTHNYATAGTYQVCLKVEDTVGLCTDTYCDSISVDSSGILRNSWALKVIRMSTASVTKISELENVNIFPNPNNGSFTLDLGNKKDINRLFISDINGKIVKEILVSKNQKQIIDFEGSSGVYFFKIISIDEQKTIKIVKY